MDNIDYIKMQEYTNQLVSIFEKPLYNEIIDLWEQCKNAGYKQQKSAYEAFQDKLEEILVWNRVQIHDAFKKVTLKHSTEYIDKLVEIVFRYNVKFLVNQEYCTKIPDNETFFHQCLLKSAEQISLIPYIADNRIGDNIEKYKNISKLQDIIRQGIRYTIKSNIMQENLFDVEASCYPKKEVEETEDTEEIEDEEKEIEDTEETEETKEAEETTEETTDDKIKEEIDDKPENKAPIVPFNEDAEGLQETKIEETAEGDYEPQAEAPFEDFKTFDSSKEVHLKGLFEPKVSESADKLTVKLN